MDLEPNKVRKSELILEARHSKSIEASNKIRASLSPRLFIPRALQRESLTKNDNNKVTTVKVKNSQISETNTTFLKDHDLTVKDQNKMDAKAIFRLVQGKYTKKANYKSVWNDNSSKKSRLKTAQKETVKIKKNTNIADGTVEETRNCFDYNDMFLQFVGLTRRYETQTFTQNSATSLENVEETLTKYNLRKRRPSQNPSSLQQFTPSKRLKSKEQPKSNVRHADLTFNNQCKFPKIDKPISAVATRGREPCSPQCDNSTFAHQKVKKQRKTKDRIISTNSTHMEKNTKSDTKIKDLKTIILNEIFKKWLKSPLETAKNNYTNINFSSATNSPLPKKSKNITRKLKNPAGHENNNQKDVEIELLKGVKSSPESNKQKSTKLQRSYNKITNVKHLEINSAEDMDNLKSSCTTTNALSSSTRVEMPQTTVTNCEELLEPVVGIISEDHLENKINCKTKSQNSPQRCIQHREELKISENTSNSSPESKSSNLREENTTEAKRYLRDGEVINLDDEPDTIDLTISGEALKNVKQSENKYITLGDFSTYWRSSCRETLEIYANVPITDQYSISSHSHESFSSHPGCMFIFEDTPPRLAGDSSDNELLSFHKSSTLVPEFQNIVRDTMSHLHTTSGQDLQINEDLMNIENSVDEFSKYLLTTFKNIEEMEEQLKQDIVYINSGEFKKLTSNTKRSHPIETLVTPKPSTIVCNTDSEIKSSTDHKKSEEMITILIQADQMPTKTITFKKSEIIIPSTCAETLIETEINLLTPPPEVIVDETMQSIKDTSNPTPRKSDVTIISNIELPSLDLRNPLKPATKLQENPQNQSNQLAFISHLEIPTLDLPNQIQRVMQQCQDLTENQINSESSENMPNTQTNLSTQDGGNQSYSHNILNFPASNQISQSIWNPTDTAVVGKENPYIMENFTENQIDSLQNTTIHSSSRIQDLIKFRRMSRYDEGTSSCQQQFNNAIDYRTAYLPPNHFLNYTSSQAKTDPSYIRKQKSRAKPSRNSRRNVYKTCNVLPNITSQAITPSKCSVSVTNSSPIYTRAPHFNSSYWQHNSVYTVVGNNYQTRNHYQNLSKQNLTRNQESHYPSYYAQPSLGNIYYEHAAPHHINFNSGLHFNNPVLFNNRPPFLNAPPKLDYNQNLVARNTNNFQFDSNSLSSLASLSSQPYKNTMSPPIPNQDAGYNYNI